MEMFAMASANLIGGILCLIIGLVIQTGKAGFLIAGYNTMSKEDQAKYDIKALSKFVGLVLITIPSIILLLASIPIFLNFYPIAVMAISWGVFMVFILVGLIYLNTGSRFKHST